MSRPIGQWVSRGRMTEVDDLLRAGEQLDASHLAIAAEQGNLDMVVWLRCHRKCPWNADVATSAARGRHHGTLKWLAKNGCPRDAQTYRLMEESDVFSREFIAKIASFE